MSVTSKILIQYLPKDVVHHCIETYLYHDKSRKLFNRCMDELNKIRDQVRSNVPRDLMDQILRICIHRSLIKVKNGYGFFGHRALRNTFDAKASAMQIISSYSKVACDLNIDFKQFLMGCGVTRKSETNRHIIADIPSYANMPDEFQIYLLKSLRYSCLMRESKIYPRLILYLKQTEPIEEYTGKCPNRLPNKYRKHSQNPSLESLIM